MHQEKSDQQKQLQVLVLADKFTASESNEPLAPNNDSNNCSQDELRSLNQCLEWMKKGGLGLDSPNNVVVAFANKPEQAAQELHKKWARKFKQLQVITAQNCKSANDVLREVEARRLLTTDFVLIHNLGAASANAISSFFSSTTTDLISQIENFRVRRRQNKNSICTLLFAEQQKKPRVSDTGKQRSRCPPLLVGYETNSQKLVQHCPLVRGKGGKVAVPKSAFLAGTTFRTDLAPTGIWLCGLEFSGHFAGNYDFHSLDQLVQDVLANEEFLGQQIHVDILLKKQGNEEGAGQSDDEEEAGSSEEESDDEETEDEEEDGEETTEAAEPVDVTYEGNACAFVAEVLESMQALLDTLAEGAEGGGSEGKSSTSDEEKLKKNVKRTSREQLDNLKLEINASKLAYNISLEELPRLVFVAFLQLPGISERVANFTELFKAWDHLWAIYYKRAGAKMGMLHAIEEYAAEHEHFRRLVPNVLKWLSQEAQLVDDDQIVAWHKVLASDSPLRAVPNLAVLVQWLEEAEEEDDDEDED